jgi:hypothetical protein
MEESIATIIITVATITIESIAIDQFVPRMGSRVTITKVGNLFVIQGVSKGRFDFTVRRLDYLHFVRLLVVIIKSSVAIGKAITESISNLPT